MAKIRNKGIVLAALALLAGLGATLAPATDLAAKARVSAVRIGPVQIGKAHPLSGLKVIPVTATINGKPHRFAVELAATDAQQEKGLMFRKKMGADEGMIFPYSPPQPVAFWMKNTVLPLDIIYIGADHRVLNIADAKPYDLTPLPSMGLVIGVLELNAGRSRALGIGPGTRIDW